MDAVFKKGLSKDISKKEKEQEKQLKKLCKNQIKEITFTLPNSNKSLTFQKLYKFFTSDWELTHINGEQVFFSDISFQIISDRHSVYLNTLYPGYPKISGVDDVMRNNF
jgi:hypothetical protein